MSSAASTLRSLVFALFQLIVTPAHAILVLLTFPLPPLPRFKVITGYCAINLWAARWICGIRHRVTGSENIPPAGKPHIVMSKHSSTWETMALNFLFRLGSPIIIDRRFGQGAMTQITAQGRERLAQGFWIVIYPEGTRIRAGTRAHYKTGGARLAIALDVPIVPVAHNAGYLWPKGVLNKRPGTITVSIGPAIRAANGDMQRLMNEVESWIENEVARLRNPLEQSAVPRA